MGNWAQECCQKFPKCSLWLWLTGTRLSELPGSGLFFTFPLKEFFIWIFITIKNPSLARFKPADLGVQWQARWPINHQGQLHYVYVFQIVHPLLSRSLNMTCIWYFYTEFLGKISIYYLYKYGIEFVPVSRIAGIIVADNCTCTWMQH
jgi:hypothetical protein